MLPEVEQYFNMVDAAVSTYEVGVDVETVKPNADGERTRRIEALTAYRDAALGSAWTLLGAVTDDKLVAWMVARFEDVVTGVDDETREALDQILKRLPMDQAELEEFADSKGWCDSFEQYLQEALEAGVFAAADWRGADSVKAAMSRFEAYVDSQVSVAASSPQRVRLRELVLEVAEAARSLAVESAADESEVVQTAPVAVEPEGNTESGLDISSWREWTALEVAANRVAMSPAYIETLKGHVTVLAVFAADHGAHMVESSAPAGALREWVTSIGGASHLDELRRLVTPVVLRAQRR